MGANQSVEVVLNIFKKLGPLNVLVEDKGQFCGLITNKVMIKHLDDIHHNRLEEIKEF